MEEIILTFKEIKEKVLRLGHAGDDGYLTVKFDCRELLRDAEDKEAFIIMYQPDGGKISVTPVIDEDDFLIWVVDSFVTGVAGFGSYQLTVTRDDVVYHSPEGRYEVKRSLEEDPEPDPEPEPTPDPDPDPTPDNDPEPDPNENEEEEQNP